MSILLPGWTCSCGCFNGTTKENLKICRHCALPRPLAKRLVLLESPYASSTEEGILVNVHYARLCMRDSLSRGEAPFASHLLYTQEGCMDDSKKDERTLGIEAGLAWGRAAEATVVYVDRGISAGMREGIVRARKDGRPVERRSLPGYSERSLELLLRSSVKRLKMISMLRQIEFSMNGECPFCLAKPHSAGCDLALVLNGTLLGG